MMVTFKKIGHSGCAMLVAFSGLFAAEQASAVPFIQMVWGESNWDTALWAPPVEDVDSDGDGVVDSLDAFPNDATETTDTDNDGLGDNYELANNLDINNSDTDGDGVSDYDEVQQGTDPTVSNLVEDARVIVQLGDLDSDGVGEVGEFGEMADGSGSFVLSIANPASGEPWGDYIWPATWSTPQIKQLADRNGDGIDEVALFGKRIDDGRMQLVVKSGATGAGMGTWSWPNSWNTPVFVELRDTTGDGVNEYAIFGRYTANNVPQLVARDGVSKAEVARYRFSPAWMDEQVVQLDDVTADGVTEMGMFAKHRMNGKTFLYITDGMTPDLKVSQYNWPDKWTDTSFHLLPDLDGDGIREPGVFGINTADGRPQLQIKKGHSKVGVYAIYNWLSTFSESQFYQVSDQNGDGINEFAVLAYNSANGKRQLMVKNGMDRTQTLANYIWPDNWDNARLVELDDLNGDGLRELGVLGDNRNTGALQLQVRDRDTRLLLNTYTFTALDAGSATVVNVGDVNGDSVPDIGLYSSDTGTGSLEIFSGDDATAAIHLWLWD